jgi:Na+-transporting NADH:ubiquinone oxidoreductase subunit D
MSTEEAVESQAPEEAVEDTSKEPLFSKKNQRLITDPLDDNNPITVQVLGICSALAITTQVKQGLVMGLSVIAVMVFGNVIISLLRKSIPNRIRIIVQLVILAALVALTNEVLKAFVYDVWKQLSVFVGLIITNCIIMGRFEAFAMGNKPWPSALDGFGNALGYAAILVIVSVFRELFGSGTLWGQPVIPEAVYNAGYTDNNMFILPPMALIVVGIIIWIQRARNQELIEES